MNIRTIRNGLTPILGLIIVYGIFRLRLNESRTNSRSQVGSLETPKHLASTVTRAQGEATTLLPSVNSTFEWPFIGEIKAISSTNMVFTATKSGVVELPFTVFRKPDGSFLRAEFLKPGSTNYEEPAWKLQRILITRNEKIIGIPKQAPTANWQSLLVKFERDLGEDMSKAVGIVITYVDYNMPDDKVGSTSTYVTRPLFTVHIYGMALIDEKFLDVEYNRRIRGLFSADGNVIRYDNSL